MLRRISAAWSTYWLAPGGRYATAVVRIALAVSLLWMLWRYHTQWELPQTRYYKLGVWFLYPGRPSAEVLLVVKVIAWVATLALLVGIRARLAHVVSLIACMAIAAHGVSSGKTWSHIDVPPLLASIAFLGAPGGAALSIDAWLRRRRGLPLEPVRQTSVRLVMLTVASVFFIAGTWKLRADGGFGLGWALSDNLRHQILVRYDWIGLPRTALAEWIVAESWRYQLVACLNLVSQLTPIAAVFLVRYPRIRALFALLFVLEVLGLALVMDLWDLHWLPLAAVYIDWDRWAARTPEPEPLARSLGARTHLAFVGVFLAFYAVQAFWLNQKLRAFPFSSFPMFAEVRAKQPYSEHQSYELLGGHIELIGSRPLSLDEQRWLAHHSGYRWFYRARDPRTVQANLRTILDEMRRAWPDLQIRSARLSLAVYQAPAYPAPAALARHSVAILGELAVDGTFRTQLHQFAVPGMQLVATPPVGEFTFLAQRAADGTTWLVR